MNRKKYAVLLSLAASLTSLMQANEYHEWNSNYAPDYHEGYVCPSDPCCDATGRFFLSADLLYWKPHVSSLELAFGTGTMTQLIVDNGVNRITTVETSKDPHFKWHTGYRFAAGYQFANSNWQVDGSWTHFNDHGRRSASSLIDLTNTNRVSVRFDQLDATIGYNVDTESCFAFKPFAGLRFAKINQNLDARLITNITLSPDIPATEITTLDYQQSYHGFGPLLGLDGEWHIGGGFGLYGTAAASLLYGHYSMDFIDDDIFSAPISNQIRSSDHRHTHGFDCNINLAIGVSWETCLCDSVVLKMKLGFEHHQYFNESRLGADRGDLTFDGGIFSVGIAL